MSRFFIIPCVLAAILTLSACESSQIGDTLVDSDARTTAYVPLDLDFLKMNLSTLSKSSTFAIISGGGSSSWYFSDEYSTSSGATAGFCTYAGVGGAASIVDADIPGQGDAYDFGSMIFVDGVPIGGALTVSGTTGTFSPMSASGLDVQVTYHALTTAAIARNLTTFSNPSGSDITVTVEFATNFGSDGSTVVHTSSSGDASVDPSDRWIVTDDFSAVTGDPANTTVFYGPDSPAVVPTTIGTTVFNCAGPEGLVGTYTLTVPAGEEVALLFFHGLSSSSTDAATDAALYDTTPAEGDDLLEGLTAADLETIVNWAFDTTIEVEIDVKPGSSTNPINLKSKGVIPVAVLTTDDFDATTIDVSSLSFGPGGAAESHGQGHIEDVDSDGDDDLMLHFGTQESGLASGDTEACLTGQTLGGDDIEGCDSVSVK